MGLLAAVVALTANAESAGSCHGERVTIQDGPAGHHIDGTEGDDVIDAGGGRDVVQGHEGKDWICGRAGNDELHGGEGRKDLLVGGPGNDFLDGRRGFDRDKMYGGAGEDEILGGNRLEGGGGDDYLRVESYAGDLETDSLDGGPDVDECIDDGHGDSIINCESR